MSDEWIAVKWGRRCDIEAMKVDAVTIEGVHSPFYEGIRYAVRRGSGCLNVHGKWEYEPMPSYRTDSFYRRCRFGSLDEAKRAAAEQAIGGAQ